MATYKVKPKDCLWSIAQSQLGKGTRWTEIRDLNIKNYSSLKNSTIIQVGWELELPGGSSPSSNKTVSNIAIVEFLGPLAGEDRTLFLKWSWEKTKTEKYLIEWIYTVEGGHTLYATQTVSVEEEFDAAKSKQTTWNVPENAVQIKVKVKPVAKTETKDKKEVTPWTAGWSSITSKAMYFGTNFPPDAPSGLKVDLEVTESANKLTAELTNLDANYATKIHFEVWENHSKIVFQNKNVSIKNGRAIYTCKLSDAKKYTVRCRACKNGLWGEYSDYSDEIVTRPAAPTKLTAKAKSEDDVYISWKADSNATGYEYQYTTQEAYFNSAPDQVTSKTISDPAVKYADVLNLETGNHSYFFRVRSTGAGGNSKWSSVVSVTLGKAPAAPTTWSSTTTAIVGSPVTLYWVHNSEDGSSQTFAKLELTVNGRVLEPIVVKNTYTTEEERDDTSVYILDTSSYGEGAQVLWRVCTAGVVENSFGEWSVQRTVDIYAEPTLDLSVTKNLDGEALSELESFPFYVKAEAGPIAQTPISYHLKVVANESYETIDAMGEPKVVSAGEAIYSRYFDNDFSINGIASRSLYVEMSPSNIDLENNIEYTLICTVAMDSGLSKEESMTFTVTWIDNVYPPNAEIGYDSETYSAIVRPYCEDADGSLVEGVVLSVYRREYDGTFTEIMTNIPNNGVTFATDPHPALDYARYRIVATVLDTGAISYYDIPGYVVNESAAIIQWDEKWDSFDSSTEEPLAEPNWTGSLVRLPYNIDISPKNSKDVTLVEYIGREHPVSYYGTHLGESFNVRTEIPADDLDTLYAIRRLMIWKGDVYVRLPNGMGCWAHVSVQYSHTHGNTTIPVTIDVTRVEGGM